MTPRQPRGPVAKHPIALLVGELNPYQVAEDSRYALYPYPERSAGGRLCRVIFGLDPHLYLRSYARHNLCSGKWSAPAARLRVGELCDRYPEPLPIVLLGSKVAAAFGYPFQLSKSKYLPFGISVIFRWMSLVLPIWPDRPDSKNRQICPVIPLGWFSCTHASAMRINLVPLKPTLCSQPAFPYIR